MDEAKRIRIEAQLIAHEALLTTLVADDCLRHEKPLERLANFRAGFLRAGDEIVDGVGDDYASHALLDRLEIFWKAVAGIVERETKPR